MPSYDQNNIFAKILRGEIPAHKVHEDEVDARGFVLVAVESEQMECIGGRVSRQDMIVVGSRENRLNQEAVIRRVVND